MININFDVPVNSRGMNNNIKINILSEEKMREIGFTDYNEDVWCFRKIVHKKFNIEFSLSINKYNSNNFKIDVLDSEWLQIYDYQRCIEEGIYNNDLLEIHNNVQDIMKMLIENNIIEGYNLGDYI